MTGPVTIDASTPRPSDAAVAAAQRAELHLGLPDETVARLSGQIRARQNAAAKQNPKAGA
jgi:hypothetical protein